MRKTALALVLVMIATTAQAKIYRWVDENGSVHFSDKPYSENAQEIIIQETGIGLHETPTTTEEPPTDATQASGAAHSATGPPGTGESAAPEASGETGQDEEKIITEDDYKITTTVGKLGLDLISISGRIASGPKCYDMTVVATATNENGMTATIRDQVRKSNTFGSVTFKGTTKATGSSEDRGFWKVDSVTVRCNDAQQ